MKRLLTLTLTVIVSIGSMSISAHNDMLPKLQKYPGAYIDAGSNDYDKTDQSKKKQKAKQIIAEINAVEEHMHSTTSVLTSIIEEKAATFRESLKNEDLTKDERQILKEDYLEKNKMLFTALDEMRRPFMEQITEKEKILNEIVHNRL